jgi:hypothetical protein
MRPRLLLGRVVEVAAFELVSILLPFTCRRVLAANQAKADAESAV